VQYVTETLTTTTTRNCSGPSADQHSNAQFTLHARHYKTVLSVRIRWCELSLEKDHLAKSEQIDHPRRVRFSEEV